MKEKSGPDATILRIQQATQLLDHGHHREALALALHALLLELYHLRASLEDLKNLDQPDPEPSRKPEHPSPTRLPEAKPRIVH